MVELMFLKMNILVLPRASVECLFNIIGDIWIKKQLGISDNNFEGLLLNRIKLNVNLHKLLVFNGILIFYIIWF